MTRRISIRTWIAICWTIEERHESIQSNAPYAHIRYNPTRHSLHLRLERVRQRTKLSCSASRPRQLSMEIYRCQDLKWGQSFVRTASCESGDLCSDELARASPYTRKVVLTNLACRRTLPKSGDITSNNYCVWAHGRLKMKLAANLGLRNRETQPRAISFCPS